MTGTDLNTLTVLLYICLLSTFELAQCSFLPSGSGGHYGSDNDSDSLTKPLLDKFSSSSSSPSPPKRTNHPLPSASIAISKGARVTSTYANQRGSQYRIQNDRTYREMQVRLRNQRRARQREFVETNSGEEHTSFANSHAQRFGSSRRNAMPATGSHTTTSSSNSSARNTLEHIHNTQPRRSLRGYIPPTLREVGVEPTSTQSDRQHAASPSSSPHEKGKKPKDGSPSTSPSRHRH